MLSTSNPLAIVPLLLVTLFAGIAATISGVLALQIAGAALIFGTLLAPLAIGLRDRSDRRDAPTAALTQLPLAETVARPMAMESVGLPQEEPDRLPSPEPLSAEPTEPEQQRRGTVGKITTVRSDKGFGFIKRKGSPSSGDLFFHMSSVQGPGFDELRENQAVTFDEERDPTNPSRYRATNVRLVKEGLEDDVTGRREDA